MSHRAMPDVTSPLGDQKKFIGDAEQDVGVARLVQSAPAGEVPAGKLASDVGDVVPQRRGVALAERALEELDRLGPGTLVVDN